jgi:hypothetical protein
MASSQQTNQGEVAMPELTKSDLEKEADTQDLVEVLADRMQLEGSDRRKFIVGVMTDCGYVAEPKFVVPDDDDSRNGRGNGRSNRNGNAKKRNNGDYWEE